MEGRIGIWKFTPVSYRTLVLWGRCPKSVTTGYFVWRSFLNDFLLIHLLTRSGSSPGSRKALKKAQKQAGGDGGGNNNFNRFKSSRERNASGELGGGGAVNANGLLNGGPGAGGAGNCRTAVLYSQDGGGEQSVNLFR